MKDEIDLILLIAAVLLVVAQAGFYLLKKVFPPVVNLAADDPLVERVNDMHDIIARYDTRGQPLIYMRDSEHQEKLMQLIEKNSDNQRELVHAINSMHQAIDNNTFFIKSYFKELQK